MKVIYIAGKYTGHYHDHRSYFEIDRNIKAAMEAAAALAQAGVGFFCPHSHCAHFEVITPDVQPAFWYKLDLQFLVICDAILMLEGWQESKGAVNEHYLALRNGLQVFYGIESVIAWAKGAE